MTELTVTTKGQITLRKDLLQHLGIAPGQKIEVHKLSGGKLTLTTSTHVGDIRDFVGCLKNMRQTAATIDEINVAIADGWAGIR